MSDIKNTEYSKKTIKAAKAALILGYDVVSRIDIPIVGTGHKVPKVKLESPKYSGDVPANLFPELKDGDCISLSYIAFSKKLKTN